MQREELVKQMLCQQRTADGGDRETQLQIPAQEVQHSKDRKVAGSDHLFVLDVLPGLIQWLQKLGTWDVFLQAIQKARP